MTIFAAASVAFGAGVLVGAVLVIAAQLIVHVTMGD
jgi:hypothetical protein